MITWEPYKTYEDAQNVEKCLYVFKKGCRYLYIGKAAQFGGRAGRYAYGYRYLVDALLESGTKLYLAELTDEQWLCVNDYENTLLNSKNGQTTVNRRRSEKFDPIEGLTWP